MSRRNDLVGLDDLFAGVDAAGEARADRPGWRWLAGRLFFSVALGTLIFGFLWVVRISVPYPLIVLTIFAVTVVRWAAVRIDVRRVPADITGRGLARPVDPDTAAEIDADEGRTADGVRMAIGRWESRLSYPGTDADRLTRVVVPRLRELVDERLRLRHGFTTATDPARAREVLGTDAWNILYAKPPRGGFAAHDLTALADRMEAL